MTGDLVENLLELDKDDAQVDTMRFDSSNLHSGLYQILTQDLYIRFHGTRIYVYTGVPHSEWMGLKAASSHGKYHHRNIKWGYPYEELTPSDWPQQGRSIPDPDARRFVMGMI